jgi:hypothetical protein
MYPSQGREDGGGEQRPEGGEDVEVVGVGAPGRHKVVNNITTRTAHHEGATVRDAGCPRNGGPAPGGRGAPELLDDREHHLSSHHSVFRLLGGTYL